jgi:hypothetical protein
MWPKNRLVPPAVVAASHARFQQTMQLGAGRLVVLRGACGPQRSRHTPAPHRNTTLENNGNPQGIAFDPAATD